jgi:photosynthetic reaction center H subunit
MSPSYPFGNFDVAELVLIAFWVFFLGLVLYLRREDRREGYPLEDDVTGRLEPAGSFLFFPSPKTFLLPHGHGTRSYPSGERDRRPLAARRSAPMEGAPIEPTGDSLADGVGPGSYAERPRYPDMSLSGEARIVPLRTLEDFHLAKDDPDPRGMTVLGCDGVQGGVVTDVWVDRTEFIVRYLELEVSGGRSVLLPLPMATVKGGRRVVEVPAIRGDQFAGVPTLENPEQVTLYEEDRIVGYYGAGHLYATRDRQEPWI